MIKFASIQEVIDQLVLEVNNNKTDIEQLVQEAWPEFVIRRVAPFYDYNLDVKSLPCLMFQAQSEGWGSHAIHQIAEVKYSIEVSGLVHCDNPELAHRTAIRYAQVITEYFGDRWATGFMLGRNELFFRDFPFENVKYGRALAGPTIVRGWSANLSIYSHSTWE
jgi:hypothetical protein